jgi:hypothetical protein
MVLKVIVSSSSLLTAKYGARTGDVRNAVDFPDPGRPATGPRQPTYRKPGIPIGGAGQGEITAERAFRAGHTPLPRA